MQRQVNAHGYFSMQIGYVGRQRSSESLGYIFAPLSFGLLKKQGKVVALEAITGKKIWEYSVEGSISGGITYSDRYKMIVFGSEDSHIHALDAKTGKVMWTKEVLIKPRGFPVISHETGSVLISGLLPEGDDVPSIPLRT